MRKEGGKKNRKHHYLTAAYCSLFLERYHCILFQSTAANTAIVEFSIFQKMSPKRVRYKQPMRELPRADEVSHTHRGATNSSGCRSSTSMPETAATSEILTGEN